MAYPVDPQPSQVVISAGVNITLTGTNTPATDIANLQWVSDYVRDPTVHPTTPYTPAATDLFTVTMSGTFGFPTDPAASPLRALFGTTTTGVTNPLPRHLRISGAAGMKIYGGVVPIVVILDQSHDCIIQGLNFTAAAPGGEWCQRAIFVGQARNVTVRNCTFLSGTGKRSTPSRYLTRSDIFRGNAFGNQGLDATLSIGSTLAGSGAFKNKIVGDVIVEGCYFDYETLADSAADPTGGYANMGLARAAADWFTLAVAASALGPTSTLVVRNNTVKNCTNFAFIGNELWSEMVEVSGNIFEMAKFEAKQATTAKPLIPFPGSSGQALHIWAGMSYGNPLNLGNYVVKNNRITLQAPYQAGVCVSCWSNPGDRLVVQPQLDNTLKAVSIVNNEIESKHAAALCGIGLYQADGCYVGQNKIKGTMKFAMVEGASLPSVGAHRNVLVGNDIESFISSLGGEIALVLGPDAVDGFVQSGNRAVWLNDSSVNQTVAGLDMYEGTPALPVPADVQAVLDYMKTGWAVVPDVRP